MALETIYELTVHTKSPCAQNEGIRFTEAQACACMARGVLANGAREKEEERICDGEREFGFSRIRPKEHKARVRKPHSESLHSITDESVSGLLELGKANRCSLRWPAN